MANRKLRERLEQLNLSHIEYGRKLNQKSPKNFVKRIENLIDKINSWLNEIGLEIDLKNKNQNYPE